MKKIVDKSIDALTSIPVDEEYKQKIGKETGKALLTGAKAINMALAPLALTVYGFDNIQSFLSKILLKKLNKVPDEDVVTPKVSVVAEAVDNLKYLDDSDRDLELKNMYANLIANAMNKKMNTRIHASFSSIIKQLEPLDVNLLEYLKLKNKGIPYLSIFRNDDRYPGAGEVLCKYLINSDVMKEPKNIELSINNLERLKLIDISDREWFGKESYEALKDNPLYGELTKDFNTIEKIADKYYAFLEHGRVTKGYINLSALGREFIAVCSECE
ncbi:DUF4393 domain-containing protein [Providencia rettgeri]|nr:DUF4393 domain-containing protein [Providencia rettgeri]QPE15937.1 DUF4393 domain-containing protein [Providencia rettgeri]